MPRLSDLPDPYAIVVMLPGTPPSTNAVNGRIARMMAWLLDHRPQIEAMRGSIVFNFGPQGFQAELREMFPYQNVATSSGVADETKSWHPATDLRIRASDEFTDEENHDTEEQTPKE